MDFTRLLNLMILSTVVYRMFDAIALVIQGYDVKAITSATIALMFGILIEIRRKFGQWFWD